MEGLVIALLIVMTSNTVLIGILANAHLKLRGDTTRLAKSTRKCLESITRDRTASLMQEKGIPGTPEDLWKSYGLGDEEIGL